MCYEVRIKKGRKVVFSLCVASMDEAIEWFREYEAKQNVSDCVFQIIPKFSIRLHTSELKAHRGA